MSGQPRRVSDLIGRRSPTVVVVSLLFALGVLSGGVAVAADVTAGLVRSVDTTAWSPAAPGPAGVVYLAARDSLLVVDSDRNNLPEFGSDGINLWEYSLSTGTVTNTGVMPTDEATGAGYDPATNTLFVSDDNPGRVYLVRPGDDGWFGTADDPAAGVINTGALGAGDTEDPAFDPATGHLFVLSGTDSEIYEIDPVDGVFGNGNDATSLFAVPGTPNDWEGLALDEASGHLLVGAKSEKQIYEITKTGTLVRIIDASGIGGMREISGLGVQPGSGGSNPTYWVADRGDTPITSDGMLFELTVGQVPGTPPVAQDQTVTTAVDTPEAITLVATDVNEDPLIYSIVDGPLNGTLSPVIGDQLTYTPDSGYAGPDGFTFRAHDGTEYSNTATVSITVVDPGSTQVIDIAVGSSTDDAEESSGGSVSLRSSDLELVRASSGDQVVGMRFTGVGVPSGSTIVDASIQFTVDETGSVPTNLEIRAQAVDQAATFAASTNNISTRATTNAVVHWSPGPWTTVGDAGPDQRTPNIAAVIQEVIDRPGWIAGNALVAIISGTGKRTAESFNGSEAAAPSLHIEWRDSSNAPPVVTITAPVSGSVFNEGETITFTATATDPEDGDLTAGLTWTSDLDGQIGTGGNYTTTLGVGFHTITAQATDSTGLGGQDSVSLAVGSTDPVLVGAGDIAVCGTSKDEATAVLIDGIPGATVFTLGDNAYDSGTAQEFADCYDPTWGRHRAVTHPAPGNHDYHTAGATGYFGYFGAAAGDPSQGWYSYDLGTWHVIVLNSNCSRIGGCETTSPQGQWLAADLASNSAACTVAYWHHPRFSSGMRGSDSRTADFWQLLYDYGADVVLSGHDHDYERFAPQDPTGIADPARGIRQFVVGTGGRFLYGPPIPAIANSEVGNGETHGVLKLTLHVGSYSWEFIPVAGGTFTDSGTAACVTGGSTNQPPVVTVTAPVSGSVFTEGDTVTFTATATDPEDGDLTAGLTWTSDLDGQIGNGGTFTTTTLGTGSHTITAQATDSGSVTGSSTVMVQITGPPVNQPPTVYAGPDLEINLGDTATLAGTVDDDGLPTGTLTQRWTQLSGRGAAGFTDDSVPSTTATFDLPGTYVLRLTADDGELTASADATIRVVDPSSTHTIEVRVAANSDDAEERATGSVSLSSSDLELVFDRGGNQTVGMRFNGLAIPQGATIIDAFIQFTAEDAHSVTTNLTIRAEAVDNAATFTSATRGISSRPGTAQAVAWSPAAWTTVGEAGSNQRTPSLVAVVQAVVDRAGWASGNSLVIMITGTGERSAESHNGKAGRAPLLHVEYASASP